VQIFNPFIPSQTQKVQTMRQLDNELQLNDSMLRERDTAIAQLGNDMSNLNVVWRDVLSLVHEQGAMVDNIESNVTSAENRTRMAVGELKKADDHLRSSTCIVC